MHYSLIAAVVLTVLAYFGLGSVRPEGMKVGVIAPQSGNFAAFGVRMHNGFELAKEDITNLEVEIVYEDACQPQQAVSAAQKLISIDKIDLLAGSFCVVGFVPAYKLLDEAGIVAFNTAPNPDDVLGGAHLISTNASIKEKGSVLGTFAATTLKGKTAAIIYYNTPLGKDYEKYFTEAFVAAGGTVVSSEVTAVDATDFRAALTKVKQADPDVLFVVELAAPLGNLIKQSRELGVEATILGNSQNEDPTIIEAAGAAAEGFYISSDEPPVKTEKIKDFERRYEEKYGVKPDVFAANAYDSLMLQATTYKKCGKSTACLLRELKSIKDYDGASGTITIKSDGTASKPNTFKVVRNGKFVTVE